MNREFLTKTFTELNLSPRLLRLLNKTGCATLFGVLAFYNKNDLKKLGFDRNSISELEELLEEQDLLDLLEK